MFRPKGQKWWDYLDQIWSAYETAETVNVSVLPALQVRARMLKAVQSREAEPATDDTPQLLLRWLLLRHVI
jgi:hypothetical protein